MRVSAREVCSHPTVLALDELTRTVLLALLRDADQWGEISAEKATHVARAVTRNPAEARECLRKLHAVRLCHREEVTGLIVVWTPRQRDDADVFATSPEDVARTETRVNGPIPGLTREQSEAL